MTKLNCKFFPPKNEGQKYFIVATVYLCGDKIEGKIHGNIERCAEDIDSLEDAKDYARHLLYCNEFLEEVFIIDKDRNIITRFVPNLPLPYREVKENWVD